MAVRRGRRTGHFRHAKYPAFPAGPHHWGSRARGAPNGPPPDQRCRSRPARARVRRPRGLQRPCSFGEGRRVPGRSALLDDGLHRRQTVRAPTRRGATDRARRPAGVRRSRGMGEGRAIPSCIPDELGQHPRARGFAKRRRRCLSRQSCHAVLDRLRCRARQTFAPPVAARPKRARDPPGRCRQDRRRLSFAQ